ncbi:MAG: PorT family protein [Flavobacteriales bacterium]|nr:PorT family protein [Flavobacteriales bacterium]
MIKHLLTIAFCSAVMFSANAQYLGVKGGLTLSNLNIDEVDDRNMRTGYHFGAYINLPLGDAFAFQPEVNYTTKGTTAQYDVLFFQGDYSFNINYIDVPLMGVIRFGEMVELHIGPYVGFLAGSSFSTEGDFGEGQEELDRDSFKSIDYGLAAGLAINFNALQLGARYHYGLQEVADSDNAKAFLGDARHSYLQVYAAIRLGTFD